VAVPRVRFEDAAQDVVARPTGLVPSFSSFILVLLQHYGLQFQHLLPHSIMLVIFTHFCEIFVGVRPSVRLFR
jgi:hypothetical protein